MSTRELFSPMLRAAAAIHWNPALRNAVLGAALMLGASALFAVQAALVKSGLERIAPLELVFFRGLVCAVLVYAYARWRGQGLSSDRPLAQLALGTAGFVSLALYFVLLGMLPLATATALTYTAPLFLALMAGTRQSRASRVILHVLVAAGFAGVCLVLEPSFASAGIYGVALGLLAGGTAALAYLMLGWLGRAGEPQRVSLFHYSAAIAVLAGIPTLFRGLTTASAEQWALVLAIGLIAALAQLAVFKAYALSAPVIPATLSYSTVIFSSLLGAWLWGDRLGAWEALGIALVVVSGVLVSAGQAHALPGAPEDGVELRRRRSYRRDNFRSAYAVFRLALDVRRTEYVFRISRAQDDIAESERQRGRITDPFRSEALEKMWRTRFHAERYAVERLLQLPPETLGGAYARHMKAHGLKPDYFRDVAPRHRMNFLRLRIHQTHDVWHVLTGFGIDAYGEIALQGFYFGQFTSGQAALIGAAFILKSVLCARLDETEKLVDAFCEGYCAGKRAQSLLAVEWEQLWGESVESLRLRYGIEVPRCRAGTLAAMPGARGGS